ncbi:MAG TPA: NAD(P)H-binding protein [Gammaproteobacteria bacterium]|nr:NAD(P)H-binding protein [Gammaproteobacteria bacterium]
MQNESPRTVLLAGATGLVGSLCLRRLLADAAVGRVVAPTRRPLPETLRALDLAGKLEEHLVDFARLADHAALFAVDQIICALGSTIKKAGSRERFREFDYSYPLQIARLGLQQGAQHFLLVSALGADAHSRIFYNRVKGELEEALLTLPYRSITIVRPSLLLGPRQELRPAEAIGQRLGFLLPERYKPIEATAVAAVLVEVARQDRPGTRILESTDIKAQAEHLLHF